MSQQAASLLDVERVRLALSILAANTPRLLIVDEITTNNLYLATKQHMVDVLQHSPGAMIVVSHEADFLTQIGEVRRQPSPSLLGAVGDEATHSP